VRVVVAARPPRWTETKRRLRVVEDPFKEKAWSGASALACFLLPKRSVSCRIWSQQTSAQWDTCLTKRRSPTEESSLGTPEECGFEWLRAHPGVFGTIPESVQTWQDDGLTKGMVSRVLKLVGSMGVEMLCAEPALAGALRDLYLTPDLVSGTKLEVALISGNPTDKAKRTIDHQ